MTGYEMISIGFGCFGVLMARNADDPWPESILFGVCAAILWPVVITLFFLAVLMP